MLSEAQVSGRRSRCPATWRQAGCDPESEAPYQAQRLQGLLAVWSEASPLNTPETELLRLLNRGHTALCGIAHTHLLK